MTDPHLAAAALLVATVAAMVAFLAVVGWHAIDDLYDLEEDPDAD